jgi:squalene synthase HpnC
VRHLHNVYAFCRYSDDLADEVDDPSVAIEMLKEWRADLERCYGGRPVHPILTALQSTIAAFDIPIDPFSDLISAFDQDCRVTRYETYPDLLDYCERSANPVGRLFLWLFGYKDAERRELSDRICTGLQLVNFWQDVVSDYGRGRVYIPQDDISRFGCSESNIAEQRMTPQFAELMRFEVDRTEDLFTSAAGLPLSVNRRLRVDIELFRRAGLRVLAGVRRNGYDVLNRRPTLSKAEKARLFLECMLGLG